MWWRPDNCQLTVSPVYDTSCWAGLAGLGWAGLQSASSAFRLQYQQFTLLHPDTVLELVRDYINPRRCSQLVSVTQSDSYAIMHQKVAYLGKKKAPNSFTNRNS